ncbi:MAG: hypothetical protein AB1715_13450, partial [Acidobacteriota bacterium]
MSLLVLADEELRQDPKWSEAAAEAIKLASSDFETMFGIRLGAKEFGSYVSDDSVTVLDYAAEDLEMK